MYDESYQNLLDYAFRIISKKRYTVHQVEEKLHKFNAKQDTQAPESTIQKAIERLQELDYLNDQKFIKDYTNQRIKLAPRGHFLIRRELQKKGISKEIIAKHFQEDLFDEFEAGEQVLKKKLERWSDEPIYKQKQKAYRFLASKGFRQDTIYRIVKSCYNLNQMNRIN